MLNLGQSELISLYTEVTIQDVSRVSEVQNWSRVSVFPRQFPPISNSRSLDPLSFPVARPAKKVAGIRAISEAGVEYVRDQQTACPTQTFGDFEQTSAGYCFTRKNATCAKILNGRVLKETLSQRRVNGAGKAERSRINGTERF